MKVLVIPPFKGSRKYLLRPQVDCDTFENCSGVCPEEVVGVIGVHWDGVEPTDAEMLQLQPPRIFMQSPEITEFLM